MNHKTCKQCGKPFTPARPLQAVCSPTCAHRKVKADKAAEKKAERVDALRRKEAIKTLPELKREAQYEFNAFIRARDANLPCISCGANPPDLSRLHAGRDAGHYRSVGSAAHLRYHEDNVHAQCVHCNQHGAGRAVDYRIGLIARIGETRVEALESNNVVHKWTPDELRAIKANYRAKLKEILRCKDHVS